MGDTRLNRKVVSLLLGIVVNQRLKMQAKNKLLILTSTFPRWPGDTLPPFVFELAKRLVDRFEVYVLTPCFPNAKEQEEMDGVKIVRFHYFIKKYEKLAGAHGILPTLAGNAWYYAQIPFYTLGWLAALLRQIKRIKPDLVHAHWILMQGLVAAILCRLYSIPLIITAHGGDVYGLRGRLARGLKQLTLGRARSITVVSHAMKTRLTEDYILSTTVNVIPMGVDTRLFHPDRMDLALRSTHDLRGPVLLFVGRFAEKKGVTYLLEAMPAVLREYPSAKLLLVGEGLLKNELQQCAKRLGLEHAVVFLGALPNERLPQYYASADVYVLPSVEAASGDKEGLPVTLMEALASGCAVVATDLPGNRDLITDYNEGRLVPQRNSEAISTAVTEILANKTLRDALQRNGRDKVKRLFDWQVIANNYSQLLDSGDAQFDSAESTKVSEQSVKSKSIGYGE